MDLQARKGMQLRVLQWQVHVCSWQQPEAQNNGRSGKERQQHRQQKRALTDLQNRG